MQFRPPPAVVLRRATGLALGVALLSGAAACFDAGPTVPPTTSFAGGATPSVGVPTGPQVTPGTTLPPWPAGWLEPFCTLFLDVVVAQELAVDIERALEEDALSDARGLAAELRDTAGRAEEQLAILGPWPPSEPATVAIATLLDLDGRVASQYLRFIDEDRRPALARARELRTDIAAAVPTANEGLAELTDEGVACPGRALVLESPPVESP